MRKMPHALAVPAVLLLAAGVAACGGAVPVTTSTGAAAPTGQQTSGSNGGASSAKPSTGASDGETASVMTLQVGDCFNYDDSATQVSSVEMVSCDTPHMYEVYNNSDIDDSKYSTVPAGDDLNTEISLACYDAFEMYVGVAYEDSTMYDATSFQPTTGSWSRGDRTINCLITSKDGQPTTGSARNTKK